MTDALLAYAGLTVNNLKSMVVQAFGANSVLAVNIVAAWFNGVSDSTPNAAQAIQQVFNNIGDRHNEILTFHQYRGKQLHNGRRRQARGRSNASGQELDRQVRAGRRAVMALYDGFNFLLTNQSQLGSIVQDFVNTANALAAAIQAFAQQLVTALDNSLPVLLKFAMTALGLGNLPQQIQNAAQIVPNFVQQTLMTVITAIAKNLPLSGLSSGGLFAGESRRWFRPSTREPSTTCGSPSKAIRRLSRSPTTAPKNWWRR